MYNMIHKFEEVAMPVGLEALRIFKAKGSIEMRKKYPSIYREDIDKNCSYNPNDDYLRALPKEEPSIHTSPWYCFTLIPNTTIDGKPSLDASLYLMQFLNWAVYYYASLTVKYSTIPKGRPKKLDAVRAQKWSEIFSELITPFSIHPEKLSWSTTPVTLTLRDFEYQRREFSMKMFTEKAVKKNAKNTFKRNEFTLKPPYFLQLCRFFARAWFEERFYGKDNATIPVKFAHYVSCYIHYSYHLDKELDCTFNSKDENAKKEVTRLFDKTTDVQVINHKLNDFTIELEKYLSPNGKQKKHTYSISISQHGCKHIFYMIARLHQHRYHSSLK